MDSTSGPDPTSRTRIRQQEVVAELGRRALEVDDLDELMRDASVAVAETLDTECVSVLESLPGDEAVLRQGVGWPDGLVGSATVSTDPRSLVGESLRTEAPIVVDDRRTDGRDSGSESDLFASRDVVSGISVVVGSVEEPWGVLGTYATERRAFTEYDAHFVQSVANVLASAIENEAAHSELREIHDRISNGILALNEAWEFTHVNQQAEEILDYDADELLGTTIWEAFPTVVGTEFEARYREAMATQESVSFEAYYPPSDAWFEEHVYPSETGLSVYFRDVTEQKRVEAELEEIYGRISDAFFALDEEWRFTYLNEHAHELINPEGRELVGENVWEAFPAATERKFRPKYERAMYEQETVSFEEYYPEPLDAWFEVRAYPSETGLSVYFRDVTERKAREAELEETITELQESEERLRLALEAGEMGTWELDLRTEDSPVRSPQHDRIFGYEEPLEEWDFDTFFDHVHPEDREMVERRFEEAFETGTWEFECRITRIDGEERVISAQGEFYGDEEGEPARAVGVVQDITERHRRERRLAESEQRYRTLAECFPNGVVTLFDDDLRYTLAAGRAFENLPVSREDLEGSDPRESWGDDVADALEPALTAALEGEERSVELAYAGREWIVHAVPVADDEGTVFGGMTVAQDITERNTYRAELERALDLLEKTERIADVAGWEVDPDTMEPYWSDHLFDLLDVDYEEQPTLDDALDVYHTEDDRKIVEGAVRAALDSGDPFDVEVRFPRPGGDVGWLRVQGDPEVVDGDVRSLRGAVQDVTEHKARERRLEEVIARLEASNERLEQFAYAASHDLQEPLRMVSSYLQLVERRYGDVLDEDGAEFLEYAVDGADRMREMIDGLLAYSRVETAGDQLEPVDLNVVFEDVRETLRMRIEESDAEITVENLPRVKADEGQLRQVFQNLVHNAIEYSGDEPPRIRVSAERDGSEWVISISDEGIGIDPDQQSQIFEVFKRLHSREEHPGTGIGLALCERIVERHGGDLWVDSTPGEGSTFSFTLSAVSDREN